MKLSVSDKLVIASLELEKSGKRCFSAEDLVVSAWKEFPDAFGLQGYFNEEGKPIYPNSNRVYAEIMGSKPLRKRGLLQKTGTKLYKLTEAGRTRAKSLLTDPREEAVHKLALAREMVEQIYRLFDCKATTKTKTGNTESLSFFDACGFWGISPRSSANDLRSKFAHLEALLKSAEAALGDRRMASLRHGASPYTREDLQSLRKVHKVLQKRFAEDIRVIEGRSDERK